jgi:hypothetical protein
MGFGRSVSVSKQHTGGIVNSPTWSDCKFAPHHNDGGFITMPAATTAERERDKSLTKLETLRSQEIIAAKIIALQLALDGRKFSADDLHQPLSIQPHEKPTYLGAALRSLKQAGALVPLGYVLSQRAAAHSRPLLLFALGDETTARELLDDAKKRKKPKSIRHQMLLGFESSTAVESSCHEV